MATMVNRKGLGIGAFLRRNIFSPERTNETEKFEGNNGQENDVSAKLESLSGERTTSEIDEAAAVSSQKNDDSKKSAKNEKLDGQQEITKTDENPDNTEELKDYVTKDDVGQIKFTEIINNSIKEAVLNIVKECHCPDSPGKEQSIKLLPSIAEETQDKENKPDCPKDLSSMILPPSSRRTSEHERSIVNQWNRELSSSVANERKTKGTKRTNQSDRKSRDVSPKISRQAKSNGHFSADNRRMTGNVNIYICSEANENTNDPKKEQTDEDQSFDESKTSSETTTCDSNLSISTSKLVAALRKKRRKNLNDQSLTCLCEKSESSQEDRSVDDIDEGDDDFLGHNKDNREFLDYRSLSSRNDFIDEEAKFRDSYFPGSSDIERDSSDLENFDRYTPYDKNNYWYSTTDVRPSYENNFSRSRKNEEQNEFAQKDNNNSCACCNVKRCQKERNSAVQFEKDGKKLMENSYHREKKETTSRYPSIVEEEDEDYSDDKKDPEEKLATAEERKKKLEKNVSQADLDIMKLQKIESSRSPIDKKRELEISENTDSKNSQSFLEATRNNDDVRDNETDKNGKIASNDKYDSSPVVSDKKRRNSFFWRSMGKAMNIVKTRKAEDPEIAGSEKTSPVIPPNPKEKSVVKDTEESTISRLPKPKKNLDNATTRVKEKSVTYETGIKPKKRSRTRISNAIASRRSSAVSADKSPSISPDRAEIITEKTPKSMDQEKSAKSPEICDCCCKKSDPTKNESCKCCKKMETPSYESPSDCPKCQNLIEGCNCCLRKIVPIELNACKCCPRCEHSLSECRCCCTRQNKFVEEFSKPVNGRRSATVEENFCDRRRRDFCEQGRKSMICIYCDKPQNDCICNAPIRKCSQCRLPLDVCNCKPTSCCECSGRQIIPNEDNNNNNEATICVTAWKPRRNVRRYFARSIDKADMTSDEEDCCCWENSKPRGSNGLSYQKRAVFSDVMSELQQKISGSVCCNVCRKVPCCCCCIERESKEKIRMRPRLSTISERRSRERSQKRSRSKSPFDNCKCGPATRRKYNGRRQCVSTRICEGCETSPCRCKRSVKSGLMKPQAKCYYCKTLPCTCVPLKVTANSRPFRNADSSRRRGKERVVANEGNNDNEDNEYRERANKRFVQCPGNQQRTRKYCYREKP